MKPNLLNRKLKLNKLTSMVRTLTSRYKPAISIVLTVTVLALFSLYLLNNFSQIINTLSIPLVDLILILSLYALFFLLHALILNQLLIPFKKKAPLSQGYIINIYSSIVNFFVFFQGGVGVRAAYLKHKFNLNYRNFSRTIILQYMYFFLSSAAVALFVFFLRGEMVKSSLVLFGLLLTVIVILLMTLLSFAGSLKKWLFGSVKISNRRILSMYLSLLVFSLLQVLVIGLVHYIELKSIDAGISIIQALGYGAVANFSIIIALTPGGIGIREALLAITEHVHGIGNELIILSGVLDRTIFFIFLFVAFIIIKATSARLIEDLNYKNQPEDNK